MKSSRSCFVPAVAFLLLCALVAPGIAGAKVRAYQHQKLSERHVARHHHAKSHERRHRAWRKTTHPHRPTRTTGASTSIGGPIESAIGPRIPVAGGGSTSGSAGSRPSTPAQPTISTSTTPPSPSSPPNPSGPPPASEPAGTVLFQGSFDGSFAGWYVQSLSYRATISTAHPYMGSGAGRFEVQPGDVEPDTGSQRSEVTGPTFHEGEDIYVRDDIHVPIGYTFQGSWQLIDQLHEKPWSGSPGNATFLDPNRRISFGTGDSAPIYWRGPQLESERWYDLVYRVNLSQDPSVGFVELWFDGVQQTLVNGQTRMYGKTIRTPETYLKAGIYRSITSTGTSIVEHDNIVVGTSLAAVLSA